MDEHAQKAAAVTFRLRPAVDFVAIVAFYCLRGGLRERAKNSKIRRGLDVRTVQYVEGGHTRCAETRRYGNELGRQPPQGVPCDANVSQQRQFDRQRTVSSCIHRG